mmetsp:Transcript_23501/g.71351  ORF Transcript_23501/g.71351 Transcript_23501/m.71351 type:complete len:279 (+) Transcript_23501:938-1774(+)
MVRLFAPRAPRTLRAPVAPCAWGVPCRRCRRNRSHRLICDTCVFGRRVRLATPALPDPDCAGPRAVLSSVARGRAPPFSLSIVLILSRISSRVKVLWRVKVRSHCHALTPRSRDPSRKDTRTRAHKTLTLICHFDRHSRGLPRSSGCGSLAETTPTSSSRPAHASAARSAVAAASLSRIDVSRPKKQAAIVFVFACTMSTSRAWTVAAAARPSRTTAEPWVSALAARLPTIASAPTIAIPIPTRLSAVPTYSALAAFDAALAAVQRSGRLRIRTASRV